MPENTPSEKVILIILDGLNYEVARDCLGNLMAYVELFKARLFKLRCELPSLSRPMYETIITGTRPIDHGVVHNDIIRNSRIESIFSLARSQKLTTAAAAFHWVSELYNDCPFEMMEGRYQNDPEQLIQHGIFYWQEQYPDSHLFADAEHLRVNNDPDFLLIHPMNIDHAGHRSGLLSADYHLAAKTVDTVLAEYMQKWLPLGYQILVTSDHGMNAECNHGGTTREEREVPLFLLGDSFSWLDDLQPEQLHICGIVCETLGIRDHGKLLPSRPGLA
ncbi:alkaline phosphatase family protein [Endozoicomonas sp. OPT23]|uniref:alkaline phosphatase family protein n=1 Tax=Endozoicomonas sp. OPT23 TaxID=2072845 RepID=UPI00351B05F8